ncbi:hypothetical protein Tsubulata_024314 [Turnera subulata]|uniref:Late embryogenesis abundant protein LEA-2 subgroup domain-containing protein n=1 Tax=Turnera subulata TaxID=218843 RepID=A0A9Q0F6I3_9ROSI|nr:hypothetical protein Tsubulata_024314 [Turnera subulata]
MSGTGLKPPPRRSKIPSYGSRRKGRCKCCVKCVCWCTCFLILLCVLVVSLAGLLYLFLQPQMPSYNVDRLQVKAFDVLPDLSNSVEIAVITIADNPNDHISLIYGKGSSVVVYHEGAPLCSGQLPAFHQPRHNVTLINLILKGKTEFGSSLQEALAGETDKGDIPLLVKVKVPVSLVLQGITLKEAQVLVNCSLVVDSLSPNRPSKIVSASYTYKIHI